MAVFTVCAWLMPGRMAILRSAAGEEAVRRLAGISSKATGTGAAFAMAPITCS
jgi:hypothetical protein